MEIENIISELVFEKIKVSQALQLVSLNFGDFLSKESKQWIFDEIDGYNNPLLVPEYRQLDCTLKVEIYDEFSKLHIETLDVSRINIYLEEAGLGNSSPNKMRISQNFESIEKLYKSESGNITMFLNDGLKKMILQWYKYPSYLKFGRIYQECPSECINVLISKVKMKLLHVLQTEVLNEKMMQKTGKEQANKKKVFISYSWDDEEHKAWVHNFAKILDAYFDIKIDVKLPLGSDINAFMEEMITESDRVLLVLTPTYKRKADTRDNGVGYESMLISDEVYKNQKSIKFVPIIRKGTKETSFPKYMGSRKGIMMTNDEEFNNNIDILINDLRNN